MNPYDIVASIRKAGYSQADVANETDVSPSVVNRVINGKLVSYNVASFIAIITDIPIDQLWPEGNYINRGMRHRFAGEVVPTLENKREHRSLQAAAR